MKRYGDLFDRIISFENLLLAGQRAQKRKRSKEYVARFHFGLERHLFDLQRALQEGTYRPGGYHAFYITDPKRRLISAASYRDRVVHHALCNVIDPIFDRTLIHDTYANRKGKGTHRAIERCTGFSRQNRYVFKADIEKYFPSIDHEILYGILARKLKCERTLQLIRLIIDNSNPQEDATAYFPGDTLFTPFQRRKGIPIGNLTSQLFANIYLSGFDHFVKQSLLCKHYVRFMDDFLLFDNSKKSLQETKQAVIHRLAGLRLRLHKKKCQIFPVKDGIDFLGFRVFAEYRKIRKGNAVRFSRRLKRMAMEYGDGRLEKEDVFMSVQSWNAHAAFGNTYGLRKKMFDSVAFARDGKRFRIGVELRN